MKVPVGFAAALGKLCVMCQVPMDQALAGVYWEALQDVPLDLLVCAMGKLLKHAPQFLPRSEKIREMADECRHDVAARQDQLALTGDVASRPSQEPHCGLCFDTGRRFVCPGGCRSAYDCPEQKKFYCAAYKDGAYSIPVQACECAQTNPNIQRRRRDEARYARPAPVERKLYE